MIQFTRGDGVFTDLEDVAAFDFLEFSLGAHGGEIDGEIRKRHLRFKNLLETVASEKFGAKAIEVKFVGFRVERREKGNSLDVIPVVVRDEDVRFRAVARGGSGPAGAERAKSGAAIEDDDAAVGRNEFEAGRVAAVAPSGGVHGGRRAAHAPEAEFGYGNGHLSFWGLQMQTPGPDPSGVASLSFAGRYKTPGPVYSGICKAAAVGKCKPQAPVHSNGKLY